MFNLLLYKIKNRVVSLDADEVLVEDSIIYKSVHNRNSSDLEDKKIYYISIDKDKNSRYKIAVKYKICK